MTERRQDHPDHLHIDEQLEALWKRYEADEVTLDEATEVMKQISLADMEQILDPADYACLVEYTKTMPVGMRGREVDQLQKLTRQRGMTRRTTVTRRVREKVLDITSPGWRERPLMAQLLAHVQRLRADPEYQKRRRCSRREMQWEFAGFFLFGAVMLLTLLLGGACWLGDMTVAHAVSSAMVRRLAGGLLASSVVGYLLVVGVPR